MLRLSNIKKDYKVADQYVPALKGLDICFRKSEFVSILGPSGCGKTTTLNIVGGLDKYTSGDLFIDGVSTKNYNDHDWDIYRNHKIGFIFQSYNLIPHQTILENVELALTISGISKKERQERARKALERVGLTKVNKKPNQLSGGQCQRVAIARALVNEPAILLADEPTGALDTVTSVQIMDLIKEISKEKLVIMVTHNPELAEKYSTRIVKLLDGELQEDSNPFSVEDEKKEILENSKNSSEEKKIAEKAKMSFWTAFRLSARNLKSKFKRTLMVALAGCIGIVGVSTVLAVSNGVHNYIKSMENDMLSGNPVYISTSTLDYTSLMGGGLGAGHDETLNAENDKSKVFISSLVRTLYNMNGVTSTNKITKEYMDFLSKMPEDACALVQYQYGYTISPNIFTSFKTADGKTREMSVEAIRQLYVSILKGVEDFKDYASMVSSVTVMDEAPSNAEYLKNQYDIVYLEDGITFEDAINDKGTLIAVVSQNRNTLNDLELAEYGYFSQEQFLNYAYKISNSPEYTDNAMLNLPESISYETLGNKKFTWYPNDTVYRKGTSDDDLGDKYFASAYSDGALQGETDPKYDNYKRASFEGTAGAVDLNVKVVLKLKKELSYGCLSSGGLYYTEALSEHIRDYNLNSEIVRSAKENGDNVYNVEMGYNFKFDGNSNLTLETVRLSSGGDAIMNYIQSLFTGSSGSKQISSYSTSALGGDEFPSNIYFYCENFEQKDILTDYLDIWNRDNAENLYKVNDEGFYTGTIKDEQGNETTTYYFYDEQSKGFYRVELSDDGYALDYKGNKYKLIVNDETKDSGFYQKLSDRIGNKFALDGQIKLSDNLSINSYSLMSYIVFNDEFQDSNIYFSSLEEVPNRGGDLYRYQNSDGEFEYVMKIKNQSFYKLALDKEGCVLAVNDGYDRYKYNEADNSFYKNEFIYNPISDKYELITTKVEDDDIKKLYANEESYAYPNVVKNPVYTLMGNDYTLDTLGLYVDMTSLGTLDLSKVKIDNDNYVISLTDYSGIDFYYKDEADTGFTYYYVDYEDVDGVGFIYASNVKEYLDESNFGNSSFSEYISDRYILNEDGTLQAVSDAFSDTPLTTHQLLDLKVVKEQLTDLSKLDVDESLKINYTDMIGLIIAMVNTLINVITYALIAFTALSLVVSTVMIGIITYVSVVERTKEIGVIRSLGGRKKDVSHLFNAETFIIGLAAGVLGIVITYLLSLLINVIIGHFAGIYTIAALPWYQALIMIALSVILTLISGLIPAKSAARKDPVVALRTE